MRGAFTPHPSIRETEDEDPVSLRHELAGSVDVSTDLDAVSNKSASPA